MKETNGIEPTRLYPYRKDVSNINEDHFSKLVQDKKERVVTYTVKSTMKNDKLKKYCLEPVIKLCKQAQVILTVNLDVENGLVNGSRGVVIGFSGSLPMVRFVNGFTKVIDYYTYNTHEEETKKSESYSQIPLMLGWAITIHKSQGMTLDYVETDLSNVFDYGQGYVTLSRVRNLKNLWIQDIDFSKLQCNPDVYEFYQNLEKKNFLDK
jgi:ATP-dependent DNA helicase PIF1